MMLMRLALVLVVLNALSACGSTVDITCDDVRIYQLAVESKRVKAPDDLDDLDPLREIPLPEASPQQPRPPGTPCIDRPPEINIGS